MKKYLVNKFSLLIAGIIFIFSGCMKDKYQNELNLNVSRPIAQFLKGDSTGSTAKLKVLALSFNNTFIEYEITNLGFDPRNDLGGEIKVDIVNDISLLNEYNDSNSTEYVLLPPTAGTLVATSYTFSNDNKNITLKAKIKSSELAGFEYALPIRISAVSKGEISQIRKVYIVAIKVKNQLEDVMGELNWDFTRWNNQTGTGATSALSFTGEKTIFATVTATTNEVASGYFFGPKYVISYTNIGGVFSNFSVKMNPVDVVALNAAGIDLVNGPTILIADPDTGRFRFQYLVFNGAAYRYIIDEYYK